MSGLRETVECKMARGVASRQSSAIVYDARRLNTRRTTRGGRKPVPESFPQDAVASRAGWPSRALAVALVALALAVALAPRAAAASNEGIHKIQHVVMIMQENRSFDSYFGTYPGANGIPAGVCVPDPVNGGCMKPFHNGADKNYGGPHGTKSAINDIDGGKMDGFVGVAEEGLERKKTECTPVSPLCNSCPPTETQARCIDVMGYHDAREIPNYWAYAHNYVLQDNMFEAAASWSLPEHLFMVSGWSAECPKGDPNPMHCENTLSPREPGVGPFGPIVPGKATYAWTDLTYQLFKAGVSWGYYVFEGAEPDCQVDEEISCEKVQQNFKTPGIWNPLADFTDVNADSQRGNIQPLTGFYKSVHETAKCGLPNVSWVVPNMAVSEHPTSSVARGQAYVTTLINSIMRSPCWNSTAIFVSWDDWGGFYDHVQPPNVDENGYGLRVPGLVISPYAQTGFIDHQQLSHDAYRKFIQDDFLSGARLNPATDGRPDPRQSVREEAPGLGDLANDFNFNQSPRPPMLLSTHPEPGPASKPPDPNPPTVETLATSPPTQTTATLHASVNPNGGPLSSCRFEYGTTISYGSSAPCSPAPGSGSSPVEVSASLMSLSPNTSYHFRISATNAGGSSSGADTVFTTPPNAPTVQTTAASPATQTTAMLNATVNPNEGNVGDCHFEYGTSEAYGSSAPCSPAPGSGSSAVEVSASLTSLSPNTTYHFRISATNAGGTSTDLRGQTFTTLPNPPAVETTAASSPAQTTATLNATVNPNDGTVSDCHFEYGTSTSYGSSAPCSPSPGSGSSPVEVSASLTGLRQNTTYHFRISATNAGGSSSGADHSFTTLEELPELGRCKPVPLEGGVHHGRYVDPACVTRSQGGTGEFEWQTGSAKGGTRSSGGQSILESVGKSKLTCKREAASGEYMGARTELVQITFTGCEDAAKVACQNEGATPGVIRASALEGRLGFIKTITKAGTLIYAKAGWDLRPAGTETDVAIFECGDGLKEAVTQVSVAGSVIVPATIDKMSVTS
jgi:phospholipase C